MQLIILQMNLKKRKLLGPKVSESFKFQIYLWVLHSANTGDSFLKC